jgi:hypothetical protein
MPDVTPPALHIDTYLTEISVAYAQKQANFIADKVFPTVPVLKESNFYAIYKKGAFFRDELKVRPLGGRPPRAGYEVDKGRYNAEEWGLEHAIDDRVRANADSVFEPDRAGMRLLTTQALIRRDRMWAEKYYKTGVWSADWEGVSSGATAKKFLQFDQSGSEPISFFKKRRTEMARATGFMPNTLVLGPDVVDVLENHSAITDRIKYTQRGVLTVELLAELFGFDRVLVPYGVINSAAEGEADSIDFLVGSKSMLMVYSAPAPSLEEPSAGYTFAWTGLLPGLTNAFGGVIERGREELAHSDILQIRAAYDVQIVASDLGQFFEKAVA